MLNPQMLAQMAVISNATGTGSFAFANPKHPMIRALVKEGYVEGNAEMVDPSDAARIAFRATPAGMVACPAAAPAPLPAPAVVDAAAVAGAPAPATTEAKVRTPRGPRLVPAVAPRTAFRFTAIPEGVSHARGAKAGVRESYPFSTLGVPDPAMGGFDSFFVSATAELPLPFKTVRSAVNSANKRMEIKGVKFHAVEVMQDVEYHVPGVRVLRVK